jgi:hypothetical protein
MAEVLEGARSKALSTNPKDLLGMKKLSLTKVSPIAIAHEAFAMMNGVDKYGPYNWRDKAVIASIYIDACKRHLDLWAEGEEYAPDSLAHHLGHARSCLGILLDAQATGNLVDDRAVNDTSRDVLSRVYVDLAERLQQRKFAKESKCSI